MDSLSEPDRACGYLVRESPDGILLAGQLTSGGHYGDLFFIPRGMVRKLRTLRKGTANAE
jgi:hypothetical protein